MKLASRTDYFTTVISILLTYFLLAVAEIFPLNVVLLRFFHLVFHVLAISQ